MSKKLVAISIAITAVMSFLIASATNNMRYDAYENDVKIFFNEQEVKFDLPVVIIDNRTYIPLRETAEKANVRVEWSGKDNAIMLTEGPQDVEAQKIFENLFGFELPDTAEILNYNYYMSHKEHCFNGKISFKEEDTNYFNNIFSKWTDIGTGINFLSTYSSSYSWWNLSDINDTIGAYQRFKTGVEIKTVRVCAFVTEDENGQYYLYVSHS